MEMNEAGEAWELGGMNVADTWLEDDDVIDAQDDRSLSFCTLCLEEC